MKVNVFLRSNVSPLGDILGLLQCLLGKNLLNLESSLDFFFFNILILVDDNELLVAAFALFRSLSCGVVTSISGAKP